MKWWIGAAIALMLVPILLIPIGFVILAGVAGASSNSACFAASTDVAEDTPVPVGQIPGCPITGELGLPLSGTYLVSENFGPREVPVSGASAWHPALDLAAPCGTPVLAMQTGTVTLSSVLFLTVRSTAGHTISYLHTEKSLRLVDVGDEVYAGQQIAVVGTVPPSTGCHLDVRMKAAATTDARVLSLVSPAGAAGYLNPEQFTRLFGIELCPQELCHRVV